MALTTTEIDPVKGQQLNGLRRQFNRVLDMGLDRPVYEQRIAALKATAADLSIDWALVAGRLG